MLSLPEFLSLAMVWIGHHEKGDAVRPIVQVEQQRDPAGEQGCPQAVRSKGKPNRQISHQPEQDGHHHDKHQGICTQSSAENALLKPRSNAISEFEQTVSSGKSLGKLIADDKGDPGNAIDQAEKMREKGGKAAFGQEQACNEGSKSDKY